MQQNNFVALREWVIRGAYIAGIDKHDDLGSILEKAKEYETTDWHDFIPELTNPRPKEFYFFELYPRATRVLS